MLWVIAKIVLFALLVILLVFYFITHILDFAESVREHRRHRRELKHIKVETQERLNNFEKEFPDFIKLVNLYRNAMTESLKLIISEGKSKECLLHLLDKIHKNRENIKDIDFVDKVFLEEYKELREKCVEVLNYIQEFIDYYDSHREIDREISHVKEFKILVDKMKKNSKKMKEYFEKEIKEMDGKIDGMESGAI